MSSPKHRYSKEEFARCGNAIYEKEVRPQLKADDVGRAVRCFKLGNLEPLLFAVTPETARNPLAQFETPNSPVKGG